MRERVNAKLDGRISQAGLLQPFEFPHTLDGQFREASFGIDVERWLQLPVADGARGHFVEPLSKRLDSVRQNADSGRHRVTAVFYEQLAALLQRACQVEALDAAARAAPVLAIATENDCGPIELLQHARRNDADNTDVP